MSADEARGFLEHILANPDDDTPRLVYADWLEEHDDRDRAEFIRVQIERSRLPEWDARQVRLRLRERALLKQHGLKWHAELPTLGGITWKGFSRGFVGAATFAGFSVLRERARACWAAAPIADVSIRWPRGDEAAESILPIAGLRELSITERLVESRAVDRFADLPLLSTLHALNVPHCNLGGEGFARLVVSPHLRHLKALRVPGNAIGNRAIRALSRASSLASLTELDLSETSSYGRTRRSGRYHEDPVLEAADVAELARWPGMAHVRSLNLSGNEATLRGLRALLNSPFTAALKELRLRANALNAEAMKEFGGAIPELQLEVLDLGDNLIGDVGASDLALADGLRELKVLVMDQCELHPSGARWLIYAPFLNSLRRLNVNYNSFGPESMYRLLEMKPSFLHTLEMIANDLGDEGAAHLAESRASNVLLEVNLANNGLGDQAVRLLAKSKHLKNLLILHLEDNTDISKQAAVALAASPLGERLAILEGVEGSEENASNGQ